ncbi:MAG: galactose mutarotase [Bacteroides sp.]|nr:galactose mutarotase [Bacteroides sp.]
MSRVRVLAGMMVVVMALCIACTARDETTLSGLRVSDFRMELDGQLTDLYILKNSQGMEVCVTNYGARVVSVMVPDRNGEWADVVAGFPAIGAYVERKQNFGATIGRYIGRILNAEFTLDSVTYQLTKNTGEHSAHGGDPGFASRVWQAEPVSESTLKLSYLSPDGENGFPGNLQVSLFYTVTEDNELDIRYEAQTDKPTVINLSHHSFFNISGDFHTSVEDQILYIDADYYTPYDSLKQVTGEILPVAGTPLDFTEPHRIGERIDEDWLQLNVTSGYDHNWVLNTEGNLSLLAARLVDEKSGRTLEVYTNEPGLQVYTANGLRGAMTGKEGIAYEKRTSVCLETQHFPDSPNQPQFPSTVLRPGERYDSRCIYRFGILD